MNRLKSFDPSKFIIALFVIPFLICGLLGIESWPFTHYPMYSQRVPKGNLNKYLLFGVTSEGRAFTILNGKYLFPTNRIYFSDHIKKVLGEPPDLNKLQNILRYYLIRYNDNRDVSKEPEAKKLRLVQMDYSFDEDLSIREDSRKYTLISEVTLE